MKFPLVKKFNLKKLVNNNWESSNLSTVWSKTKEVTMVKVEVHNFRNPRTNARRGSFWRNVEVKIENSAADFLFGTYNAKGAQMVAGPRQIKPVVSILIGKANKRTGKLTCHDTVIVHRYKHCTYIKNKHVFPQSLTKLPFYDPENMRLLTWQTAI